MNTSILHTIIDKCDFLYNDAVLSDEYVVKSYLTFFAGCLDPTKRSVSFAFHTGSLCFDAVSVAALTIGCLLYEISSNDAVLSELESGDMVLYKNQRYHWGGIEKRGFSPGDPQIDYMILYQDAAGKNGPSKLMVPYERNKHLVQPYYGASMVTDGRGIRKDKSNRSDFLSHILEIPLTDIPTTIGISVVVVADKNRFIEIYKHLRIRYSDDKYIDLADIVPASYYISSEKQSQIGKNVSKAEAVIKVTSKLSTARELVLDKHSNKVVGLLITNIESLTSDVAELNDLLRRKALKFSCVASPFNSELCDFAMEKYEDAQMFACTKELLISASHKIQSENKLTLELNKQLLNMLLREIRIERVEGCWTWETYKAMKDKLYVIKKSNWAGEDRDNFILYAMAIMNLFATAFFGMQTMEKAIEAREINAAVVSPKDGLSKLRDIALGAIPVRDECEEIVHILLDMYSILYLETPKELALQDFLNANTGRKTAIVVPKAYYSELFDFIYHDQYPNVTCVTANRFNKQDSYDYVIALGDVVGKRFDALQCYSAPEVLLFLYDFENKTFSHRKRKLMKTERKLNARIKGLKGVEYARAVEDTDSEELSEQTLREFFDLDDFVNSMGLFDFRKLTILGTTSENSASISEVKYVGIFTTGEHILFSKYYSAVVFDQIDGRVVEKAPENLHPGDIIVFAKRDNYTSNIVDRIFDQLMRTKKLSAEVRDAAEKACYWKEILREYKETNDLTYRALAKKLNELGSSLQEVTIRQWLAEESHIVGPREIKSLTTIAKLTGDPYLLNNPEKYFEACKTVRSYRRKILTLIGLAINDKLSNKNSTSDNIFEVVYENVDKLSETMELDKVFELDEVAHINNNMVNRPIVESEVLL